MAKKTTQYIWEKLISKIEGTKVTFDDWTNREFTETQMLYIVTEEPKDLTAFRDLCVKNIVKDMLDVIEKHDVKKWDIDNIMQVLVWSYNEAFLTAVGKIFGTYDPKLHSSYFQEEIRISDIKRVLDNF